MQKNSFKTQIRHLALSLGGRGKGQEDCSCNLLDNQTWVKRYYFVIVTVKRSTLKGLVASGQV